MPVSLFLSIRTTLPPKTQREEKLTNLPFFALPRRRSAEDRHVVAQDNVEIITDEDEIPPELFNVAGKFFKRFDKETCTFVSNIKEFYPDD